MTEQPKGLSLDEAVQRRLRKEQYGHGPEWRDGFLVSMTGGGTLENPYEFMGLQYKLWVNGWARGEEFKSEMVEESQ